MKMIGRRFILLIAVIAALSVLSCGKAAGAEHGRKGDGRASHETAVETNMDSYHEGIREGASSDRDMHGVEHQETPPLHGEEVHRDGPFPAEESSHGEEVHHTKEGEPIETEAGHRDEQGYHTGEEGRQPGESEDAHGMPAGDGGHGHQAQAGPVPLVYLLYWGLLILIMVIILIYFVYRVKRTQSRPLVPLAVFLVLFAVLIYIIEILAPAFSGIFDPAAMRVVHQFHEEYGLGFLRFFYKFLLGIFLTIFAWLNLDRERYFQ